MESRLSSPRSSGDFSVSTRVAVASGIGIAIFFVLLLRLWALTVLSGSTYVELAQRNQVRQLPVEAPRGAIVDRAGRPLVTNRAAREVVVDLQDVPEETRPALFRRLAKALGMRRRDVEARVKRGAAHPLAPIVIAGDVTDDRIVFYLEEQRAKFPGVQVRERYVRNYVGGSLAAHMLGQVGEVTAEQLEGEYANLEQGDRVGQSGLERMYDEHLRGTDGYDAVEVDAVGVRHGKRRGMPATPGNTLRLSVDMQLQRATERALVEGIRIAHRAKQGGEHAYAGAAVAIDPRTGEVLALASHPTYDPNIFVTPGKDREITSVLTDRRTPLSNRAISGLYPPGSIYKPITGIAAMAEGFITADTALPCPGYLMIAGTRFNNWTTRNFGSLTLPQALEASCNTYFYKIALDFYNTPGSRLQDWSARFGLGEKSGIDLPGEEAGLIPTPSWRKQTFDGWSAAWTPGHSVNLSIGQGDLRVTPLQMTMLYGALANGGTLFEPRIARSVEDPGGKEIKRLRDGASRKLPVTTQQLAAVHRGLELATNGSSGTATAVFADFPVRVVGKTGTAEKPPGADIAWYCAYAPAANPTIAACAMIEQAGHGGTIAAPTVRRMLEQHFDVEPAPIAITPSSD